MKTFLLFAVGFIIYAYISYQRILRRLASDSDGLVAAERLLRSKWKPAVFGGKNGIATINGSFEGRRTSIRFSNSLSGPFLTLRITPRRIPKKISVVEQFYKSPVIAPGFTLGVSEVVGVLTVNTHNSPESNKNTFLDFMQAAMNACSMVENGDYKV